MSQDPLLDRQASWWAKLDHAKVHIARLTQACEEYRERKPVEVRAESVTTPGEVVYRFHQSTPVPVQISLILGDVLHNLRSALDSLMLALVRLDMDRDLTEEEERVCQFPIAPNAKAFKDNLSRATALGLISDQLRASLREGQPFRLLERYKAMDVQGADALTYEEEAKFNPLVAVNRLSNIDKHRRVAVAAWWPSMVFWSGDGGTQHQWHPNPPPYAEGDIVGVMRGDERGPDQVVHEFELVLPEAPYHEPERYYTSGSLPDEIANWHLTVNVCMGIVIAAYRRVGHAE